MDLRSALSVLPDESLLDKQITSAKLAVVTDNLQCAQLFRIAYLQSISSSIPIFSPLFYIYVSWFLLCD